jgi:Flp pilus assembly protein TadG
MFSVAKFISRSCRRFKRDQSGNAAVEFGLVALPFFLLLLGLGELGLIGFAQTSLDHAATEVARQIRTGQSQMGGQSQTQIKAMLCDEMNNLVNLSCDENLFLDVDTFASFVTVSNTSPISGGTLNTSGFGYNPGVSSSIVVVRAYYKWHVLTPIFQEVFANMNDGDRLLVSTLMFRNEPY